MSQQELLKKAIQVLNQAKIQYMITDSAASSLQGEPRSTRRHISTRTVEKVFEDTVKKAGIKKDVSVHSLQAFLYCTFTGKWNRFTIYIHVSKKSIGKIVSPLDNLETGRGDR